MVRCKFKCHYKEEFKTTTGEINSILVKFSPVTSGSPENENFFKWTPGGELSFYSLQKESGDQFEIGKEYYIDIQQAQS